MIHAVADDTTRQWLPKVRTMFEWINDNDLPLMKFVTGLHTELLTLFSDEIPPLVGQVGELTPAVPNGNGGGRRTSTKPSIVGTAPCRNSCEPSYVPRAGKLKQSDGGGVSFGQ